MPSMCGCGAMVNCMVGAAMGMTAIGMVANMGNAMMQSNNGRVNHDHYQRHYHNTSRGYNIWE